MIKLRYKKDTGMLIEAYDSAVNVEIKDGEEVLQISDDMWKNALVTGHNKVNKDGITELFDFRTQEEIEKQEIETTIQEAKRLRAEAMFNGFEYNGYMISVTSSDGNGMLQVKAGFELGVTETIIHFENGTKLPMKAEDFANFSLLFISERSKFFNEN